MEILDHYTHHLRFIGYQAPGYGIGLIIQLLCHLEDLFPLLGRNIRISGKNP